MAAYYNEIDPYAAQWLRNLIAAGHIADGEVDERSIEDVKPEELKGFKQCHFFAGIGVWSYALRQAGWSDDKPVWSGSAPCQPFSAAGTRAGFADERHLWPAFYHLIQQCKPAVVFGEQIASKDALTWIDLVANDLEGLKYAFAAADFPASAVGAPHIRQRLYWVASLHKVRGRETFNGVLCGEARQEREAVFVQGLRQDETDCLHTSQSRAESAPEKVGCRVFTQLPKEAQSQGAGEACEGASTEVESALRLGPAHPRNTASHRQRQLRADRTADACNERKKMGHPINRSDQTRVGLCPNEYQDRLPGGELCSRFLGAGHSSDDCRLAAKGEMNAGIDDIQAHGEETHHAAGANDLLDSGIGAPHIRDRLYWVGDSISKGLEGLTGDGELQERKEPSRPTATTSFQLEPGKPGPTNGFWAEADWLRGQDGLWRAVEPGTSPLADGTPSRVGRLRSYGNAINAEAAKAFIESYLES